MSDIHVNNVGKAFGDFVALDNVSISVPSQSIFGLLGPNGAGKTTLIRIITGITGPDSGTVLFGKNHTILGYLPEERGLYKKMKVWEQAIYLTQLKGFTSNEAKDLLKPWFEKLKMSEWLNKEIEALSKGMQQRLQFAITVAPNPDVLILDEPFSGFDPVNAEEIKREILALNENGTTVILSTHNMNSVEELCSHVALLNRGEVVVNDSLQNVKNEHKESHFSITFSGSQVAFANLLGPNYEVLKMSENGNQVLALIKAYEGAQPMKLLSVLSNSFNILKFEEQLPTMNDLFISMVTNPSSSDE